MSITKAADRMKALIGRYLRDRRGVTALTFALSSMVLLGATFAAIDASRVSSARSELQDGLDAAILAAGIKNSTDSIVVNKVGSDFIKAQLSTNPNLQNLTVNFTLGPKTITGTASADVDPVFMDLFTGSLVKLTANSEVVRGQDQTIELALVLDTTGSMAGTKITTLKTAATSLVTKLFSGNATGVKIGVVPFANYVNVGVASRNQPWATVPADYSVTTPAKTTTTTPSCDKTTCIYENYSCTKYNDGVPYNAVCTRTLSCTTVKLNPCPGPVTTTTPAYTSNYTFRGCYGSPNYPQNVRDKDLGRKYPGFLNLNCSKQITPLTSTAATVTTAIAALTASDETYIPAGLAWGFNMLSQIQPLTDAAAYDTTGPNMKPRKVLILMTDGANTKLMNKGNGAHDGSVVAPARAVEADNWTAELCTYMKAEKIEIYTVAFEIPVGDNISRDMVRNCATNAAHYYEATDSVALIAAFEAIGASLQSLRISK